MKKRDKIIYWVATVWLCFGMAFSGGMQLFQIPEEVEHMGKLGYPAYFLVIIGVWKMLGVLAVLVPKYPLVKEWAYAGFVFVMTGALATHIAVGDEAKEFIGPSLLLVLTIVSYLLRPSSRKLQIVKG